MKKLLHEGVLGVVMMLEVIVAALLGIVVFGNIPGLYQIIGGCMILMGGTLLVTGEGRKNSKEQA